MSLVPTTELEAVNLMLAAIGESPVQTLEQSGQVDAVIAQQTLRETSLDVQSRGWRFNTDLGFPLKREAAEPFAIPVPTNAARVEIADAPHGMELTVRGGQLWDRVGHTARFPDLAEVKADIVWLLPFSDLPQAARRLTAVRAARIFQDRVVGDNSLHRFGAEDEKRAEAGLRKFEAKTARRTLLDGGRAVLRVLDRRLR